MAKFQNGIDLWKIRDKGQLRNYVTYRRNFKLDIRDLKINYDTKKFKTAGPKCISADGVNRGKLYYHIHPRPDLVNMVVRSFWSLNRFYSLN